MTKKAEIVYLTKRIETGGIKKPQPFLKATFEKNRKAVMGDGWREATEAEMKQFFDIEEVKPEPKKKATKKEEEK